MKLLGYLMRFFRRRPELRVLRLSEVEIPPRAISTEHFLVTCVLLSPAVGSADFSST